MGTHYVDKRASKATLAHLLADRGWKLYGYHGDQSDSHTDYYSPASWSGIAAKDGAVVVVDYSPKYPKGVERDSGKEITENRGVERTCHNCNGTGTEPDDVKGMEFYILGVGTRGKEPDIKQGDPCQSCKGTGTVQRFEPQPTGERWPTFHANPGNSNWHVERDGRILDCGTGVFQIRHGRETGKQIADRIDKCMGNTGIRADITPIEVDEVTITPSNIREGFVEIRFPEKPSEEVRSSLKANKFRWAKRSMCWYGPQQNLPAELQGA